MNWIKKEIEIKNLSKSFLNQQQIPFNIGKINKINIKGGQIMIIVEKITINKVNNKLAILLIHHNSMKNNLLEGNRDIDLLQNIGNHDHHQIIIIKGIKEIKEFKELHNNNNNNISNNMIKFQISNIVKHKILIKCLQ